MDKDSLVWWSRQHNKYHLKNPETNSSKCGHSQEMPLTSPRYMSYNEIEVHARIIFCINCVDHFLYYMKNGRFSNPIAKIEELYSFQYRMCSEERCDIKGLAPIPNIGKEKKHYCVDHNPMIVIKKENIKRNIVC